MKINLKKLLKDPDFVGWMIWLALTIVLSPPCIYLMFKLFYGNMPLVAFYVVGIFVAAMLSGAISAGVNELWYRMKRRQGAAKRKNGKKAAKTRAR